MKICEDNEQASSNFWIDGNLYKIKDGYKSGEIYIACSERVLVNIKTGDLWEKESDYSCEPDWWENVTDQYCLKRIK